jgi:hypothetical protein
MMCEETCTEDGQRREGQDQQMQASLYFRGTGVDGGPDSRGVSRLAVSRLRARGPSVP